MSKINIIIFSLLVFCLPSFVRAEIIITEIMYNPEGTDSGREWIEVYNSGSEGVDLTTYKLLENEINHKITAHLEGQNIIGGGDYAIIASDSVKFASEFSTYTGLLFDSVFALNNTGESLAIVDSEGNSVNEINYTVELGADGTGNSLQLNNLDNGVLIPAEPTIGAENATEAIDESVGSSDDGSQGDSSGSGDSGSASDSSDSTSFHESQTELSDFKPKIDLEISAGRNRYVSINTPISFEIKHNQENDKGLISYWSFGDGEMQKGNETRHTYLREGEYNIVLNSKKDSEQAVSRAKVFVSKPEIEVKTIFSGNYVDILLKNLSKKEINLGDFKVYLQGSENSKPYKIAKDTIISTGKEIILPYESTGFYLENFSGQKAILNYPNGQELAEIELSNSHNIPNLEKLEPYIDPEKIEEIRQLIKVLE